MCACTHAVRKVYTVGLCDFRSPGISTILQLAFFLFFFLFFAVFTFWTQGGGAHCASGVHVVT